MANLISTTTQGTPAISQAAAQKSGLISFARAAKKHTEQGNTFTSAPPWGQKINSPLPVYGFMSGFYIVATGTGGAASVTVTANEDAPWSLFNNILFSDVNGTPIMNLDGYSAYLAALYGGYRVFRPDSSTYAYSAVATGASASGNFKFILPVFCEFSRDGMGSLPNMDASAAYRLQLVENPSTGGGGFYGTAPNTTVPTVSITLELLGRAKPAAKDAFNNSQVTVPPAPGTVQYWTLQQFPVLSGTNTVIFNRVGNIIRNHILIFRASSDGTRATAESGGVVPTVLEMDWDAGQRYVQNVASLRESSYQITGIDAPNGVIPLLNTADADYLYGAEYGEDWLPTVGSTKLQLKFTSTAAGTLYVLTNDIVPGAGDVYSAAAQELVG